MGNSQKTLFTYATQSTDAVLTVFDSTITGLTEKEARKRLLLYGRNVLIEEEHPHWILRYLANFKNPLVLILLFAAIVSFVIGQDIDAVIISCIVLLSTLLNFFQEFHADQAAKRLKEKVAMSATVLREGKEEEVKAKEIVKGDIILLNAGDLVPADVRVLQAKDFFVNESSLTGESFPVEKDARPCSQHVSSLTSLSNMVFSGSNVTTGSATAVVVATGTETEIGKIGKHLSEPQEESDFAKGIKSFSLLIMRTTIFFVLFVFLFTTIFKHTSLFESFTFAVALAVGLTPELLPIIMSVNMARGSVRMAKKGAIIKRLAAIPSFGSMDVLCTDKTGTLTEAVIELVKYIDVSGNHSEKVLQYAYLNSFYQTGIKNPMDEAVIRYKREDTHHFPKIDEIPFDFLRKRMSVVVEHEKERIIITKGAPEEILRVTTAFEQQGKLKLLTPEAKKEIHEQYEALSKDGFRVLAIAIKKLEKKGHTYSKDDEHSLELIGFIAFLDPAKKDAKDALQQIQALGIEVKVISGDNELVVQKICEEVGLPIKGILLGREMHLHSDEALKVLVEKTTIFARVSPDEKNRIIRAIKANGHGTGYMGDGINDAPSLKTADIGISVQNGVDVAKESADIILTHKSLHELKDGIIEGRKTFANTMKYIMMGVSSNFGNMFSVLGAVFFIPFLPMLSIQILLNNLLYDLSQITLPTDSVDKEYIEKPRKWDMDFIKKFMIVFGSVSSLYDFFTFFVIYGVFRLAAPQFQTAWFLESLMTQTLVIHIIRTRHLPFLQSRASTPLRATTLLIVLLGWGITLSPLGKFFGFAPLSTTVITLLFLIVGMYLVSVEIAKEFFYKRFVIN